MLDDPSAHSFLRTDEAGPDHQMSQRLCLEPEEGPAVLMS
jgi:hypothetical protein